MNYFHYFHKAIFAVFLYGILTIPYNPSLWQGLGDPYDYMRQSQLPLTKSDFYFPKFHSGKFYPRPFVVPFIYKIAETNPEKIVVANKLLLCFAAYLIVITLLPFIKYVFIRYLSALLIYALMSWWTIAGWTNVLLSETISCSLLFIWIASIVRIIKNFNWGNISFFFITSFLLAFTRDTWSCIVLLFSITFLMLIFFFNKSDIKKAIGILFFSIALFIFQQYTAGISERYRISVFDTIVVRITQNQEYLNWFKENGMPYTDMVANDFKGFDITNDTDRLRLYSYYYSEAYGPLMKWVTEKGKPVYSKFLITHPLFFFLMHEKASDVNKLFSANIQPYIGTVKGFCSNVNRLWPLLSNWLIVVLVSFCCYLFFKQNLFIYLLPLILLILNVFNALLNYNGDFLELDRHLYITTIISQFTGVLSLILLSNYGMIFLNKSIHSEHKFFKITKGLFITESKEIE